MAKEKLPATQAIRVLKKHKVGFSLCPYPYEDKGGTTAAARALGVDEHLVIKTLVMEDQEGDPFLILMHGDREVSTKGLARQMGVKTVRPCDPDAAQRHTGYQVGGISPFGTRKTLPVYVEASILESTEILINAGKRGLLARMAPEDLKRVLSPIPVSVSL